LFFETPCILSNKHSTETAAANKQVSMSDDELHVVSFCIQRDASPGNDDRWRTDGGLLAWYVYDGMRSVTRDRATERPSTPRLARKL